VQTVTLTAEVPSGWRRFEKTVPPLAGVHPLTGRSRAVRWLIASAVVLAGCGSADDAASPPTTVTTSAKAAAGEGLEPASAEFQELCRRNAAAIGSRLRCPTLVPVGTRREQALYPRSSGGDLPLSRQLVTIEAQARQPVPDGHWMMGWGRSSAVERLALSSSQPPMSRSGVAGVACEGETRRYPPDPVGGMNSGHVAVLCDIGSTTVFVSVHGTQRTDVASEMLRRLVIGARGEAPG